MDHKLDRLYTIAGVGTWFVVCGFSLVLMLDASAPYAAMWPEALLLQVGFLLLFLVLTRAGFTGGALRARALLGVMLLIVLWLGWRIPIEFFQIYTIMWIALAAFHFSMMACVGMLLGIACAWYLIALYSWNESDAFFEVALFATFHFFALLSSMATTRAMAANERSEHLNAELVATQNLLTEATRQSERTRIARNLHDVLGHHLTALTIHLQVASRMADGEVQQRIEQCHHLSKLLLSDVREAVSTLRDDPAVDIRSALDALVQHVPRLKIRLDVEDDVRIHDAATAQAVVRCVQEALTNTLRHSEGCEARIRVWREGNAVRLSMGDDGRAPRRLVPGHGLKGMRERVEQLGGEMSVQSEGNVQIEAHIPAFQS